MELLKVFNLIQLAPIKGSQRESQLSIKAMRESCGVTNSQFCILHSKRMKNEEERKDLN